MALNLRTLRAFYLVGKYGSLAKAASYLKLTRPAISIQIKTLERELGASIFEHYPNKLVLTPKGHALLKQVILVFDTLTKMKETVANEQDSNSGPVSVVLGRDLALYFARQLAAFSRKYPNIRLTILTKASDEAASLIVDDVIDIGVSRLGKVPRRLQKKTVITNSLYLVFSKNNALSAKTRVSLSDTAACRLIIHARGAATRRLIETSYAARGITIPDVLEVGTCEAIIEFVRLGLGIGYVHDICLPSRKVRGIRWVEMAHEFPKMNVSVLYKRSTYLKPACHALIDHLVSSNVGETGLALLTGEKAENLR